MLPDQEFTRQELLRYNGDDHPRKLVAYQGVVYDVSDCPKWRLSLHEGLHFPGQDLTEELRIEAPHEEEVFLHDCVKLAGRLVDHSNPARSE